MKKRYIILILCISLLLLLIGCGTGSATRVETMKGWSFQYNEGTNDFSLFFALSDKNDNALSAEATVEIRIENDAGEVVFNGTKNITINDFGYYTSEAEGERYLANVRIPASEITAGKSANGTVYFTVSNENGLFFFDECNCSVSYCLPILDFNIDAEGLPKTVNSSYGGYGQSTVRIDSISYKVEETIIPMVTVTIIGEKLYEDSISTYDVIEYKIYDTDGYMVDSGSAFLTGLNSGDKFRDDSIVLYDLVPGEIYTLKFS